MHDVIVIGTGPAGISAAIYTVRAELKTAVFGDVSRSGAYRAHIIENYFAMEKPMSGPELMQRGIDQAKKLGAEFFGSTITHIVCREDGTFSLKDSDDRDFEAKMVIIASGLSFKPSGIEREAELQGKGLSFCVTCDGPFFKGKKCAVIGSGDFAAEEAVQLTAFTKDITVLSHSLDFKFSEAMKKALEKHGIKLEKSPRVRRFTGEKAVEGVEFTDGRMEDFGGVFLALGTAGAIDFARELGIETKGGYVVADPKTGRTNVPGVYAAGDCVGGNAQIANSIGQGCNAAVDAIKSLKGLKAYVDYS